MLLMQNQRKRVVNRPPTPTKVGGYNRVGYIRLAKLEK